MQINMFQKILQFIKQFAKQHKIIAAVIIILIVVGIYYGYKVFNPASTQVRYVTAAAQKGTIVISVSASGQVSASNQINITPKVSGQVIYVGVSQGQQVKAGTLLVQLDATDAQKSVRDAEVSLQTSQLTLEKLQGSASSTIPLNKQQALDNLKQDYDSGFNNVSNAFLDLPAIMNGLQTMLFSPTNSIAGGGQENVDYYVNAVQLYDGTIIAYGEDAKTKYNAARKEYDQNFQDYKSVTRFCDTSTIESLINETYNTTKTIADALKSANNLIQFYKDKSTKFNLKTQAIADTHLSTLSTYTGQTNTHIANLLNIQNTIKNDKDAVTNADIDLQSQQLAVKTRQNALLDARQNLANYYVRAPFDGLIAAFNVQKFDSIGASTAVATIITEKKLAEVSLNEVDVASVKVGNKATLTFDAVPNFTISGQVAEIDTIGTVSQGVVNYNVKIGFDTQDKRIKPGMSVNASIITETKQDVIIIPNSAVKSNANLKYVEVLINNAPFSQTVETGLSNDTMTEITSGLGGDEQVITQTITANATAVTQSSSAGGIRIPGLGGGGIGR